MEYHREDSPTQIWRKIVRDTVKNLIEKYLAAKAAEQMAIDTRVAIGNEIAARLGTPAEGSATHEVDGYKVKVTQPVNRKVDFDALRESLAKYPGLDALIKTKFELDTPGLKWLRDNDQATYAVVCKSITATPGRVAVEIKEQGK